MKLKLDVAMNRCLVAERNNMAWSKDKWEEDEILNDYFAAMAETVNCNDVLFLGP